MNPQHRFNLVYLVIAFALIFAFQLWFAAQQVVDLSYSEFMTALEDGRIAEVTVTETRIEGRFVPPLDGRE